MVEKFIEEHSGKYKKTELFKKLPKKVMWQTFQVIMEYLETTAIQIMLRFIKDQLL
jgi:hypothetical protein